MTTVYVKTQCCLPNAANSEYMKGLLQQAKFELASDLEQADVIIINACADLGFSLEKVKEIKEQYPYKLIVLAGCITQTEKGLKEYSLLSATQVHHIVEVVEEVLHDNIVKAIRTTDLPPLSLPKIRNNPIIEIIPLSRSDRPCALLKTKQAQLYSYPQEEIVNVARQAVQQGVKEIVLTSQNTMCYGVDIGTNLPRLLKELVQIPGIFKIRLDQGNAADLLKIKQELFPLFHHEKMFKFLHVPTLSGSNKILKALQCECTNEDLLMLLTQFRAEIPTGTIATNIIVGHSQETDDDYWQTLETVRKTMPNIITISSYNTKNIEIDEKTRHRSKVLTDIYYNIATLQHERWRGWEGEILIEEAGMHAGQWIGRNDCYLPVLVEGKVKAGDVVKVKIVKTTAVDLRAVLMS